MFYVEKLLFCFYSESVFMHVEIQHNKAIILVFLLIHFTSLTYQQCMCVFIYFFSFFTKLSVPISKCVKSMFYLAVALTINLFIQ